MINTAERAGKQDLPVQFGPCGDVPRRLRAMVTRLNVICARANACRIHVSVGRSVSRGLAGIQAPPPLALLMQALPHLVFDQEAQRQRQQLRQSTLATLAEACESINVYEKQKNIAVLLTQAVHVLKA